MDARETLRQEWIRERGEETGFEDYCSDLFAISNGVKTVKIRMDTILYNLIPGVKERFIIRAIEQALGDKYVEASAEKDQSQPLFECISKYLDSIIKFPVIFTADELASVFKNNGIAGYTAHSIGYYIKRFKSEKYTFEKVKLQNRKVSYKFNKQ